MKKLLLLFLPFLFPCLVFAQAEPANYKNAINQFKDFYGRGDAEQIFNMFNPTMQTSLPLEKTKQTVNQLKSQLGDIKSTEFKSYDSRLAVYKTTFTNGIFAFKLALDAESKIAGFFVQAYQEKLTFKLSAGLTESSVSVKAADAVLAASLIMPAKNSIATVPVVLIIAGSGPTDRNGNSGNNLTAASYLMLADALGKAGIATLRYDKRNIGESRAIKAINETRFEDMTADAAAMVKYLKADTKFSKVIVLGHSEGSLIGMLAAEKEKADAFVSLAGAGDFAQKILAVQLKNASPEQYKISMGKVDSLSKGLLVKAADSDPLFNPSVQPYLISWFKYNPQTEIKKLKIPVLIVQGTNDIQVSVGDAQKLKKAKPNAKLILIEGMNHVLKPAPADREKNIATYTQSQLPLDSKLINAVTDFVNQLK